MISADDDFDAFAADFVPRWPGGPLIAVAIAALAIGVMYFVVR